MGISGVVTFLRKLLIVWLQYFSENCSLIIQESWWLTPCKPSHWNNKTIENLRELSQSQKRFGLNLRGIENRFFFWCRLHFFIFFWGRLPSFFLLLFFRSASIFFWFIFHFYFFLGRLPFFFWRSSSISYFFWGRLPFN